MDPRHPTRDCFAARATRTGAVLASLCAATAASALPFAVSTVYLQAGRLAGDNQVTVGPAAGLLAGSNSHDAAGVSPLHGAWQEAASTSASTHLSGLDFAVGLAVADAQVSVTNTPAQATATGSAMLSYYLEITLKDPAAHPDVLQVPVSFSATGHGEISDGFGRIFGSAALSAQGFPYASFRFSYEGAADSRSFNDSVTLPLAVGGESSHIVTLVATATAYNFAMIGQSAGSQASVSVDPVIRFDQSAFDAQRGDATFDLTQAYSLNFSTVPVPEPAAAWLLLAGGVVLRLSRRH